jgi:hypothetical protein
MCACLDTGRAGLTIWLQFTEEHHDIIFGPNDMIGLYHFLVVGNYFVLYTWSGLINKLVNPTIEKYRNLTIVSYKKLLPNIMNGPTELRWPIL